MRSHLASVVLACLAACGTATSDPATRDTSAATTASSARPVTADTATMPAGDAPIVLELFTSQGCSSCPSAEALLNRLARDGHLGTRTVAPLAFHVDYWDDLGWPDPYASAAWTERQRQYASALGDSGIYTPELVVGGRAAMVGSNTLAIGRAVAAAPPPRPLAARATWTDDTLTVETTAPADADVFLAVWEDGTKTSVPRGENAGETLVGDRVVRTFRRIATRGQTQSQVVTLDAGGHHVGALVFAQRDDHAIVASALLPRR